MTSFRAAVPEDYGLQCIAEHLDSLSSSTTTKSKRVEALKLYWQGAELEANNDISGAIRFYRSSYKLWPELDSISQGGLPCAVRKEALPFRANLPCSLLNYINLDAARDSEVMRSNSLLTNEDIDAVNSLLEYIHGIESPLANNSQNATHIRKTCTFMNNPPHFLFELNASSVLKKLLNFGHDAYLNSSWTDGCLNDFEFGGGGFDALSIRVIEHWCYKIGGGLTDPMHYDENSIITIVALLSDELEFEGGEFRTHESSGAHQKHDMKKGDAISFVSHKYHNVSTVTSGSRRSLVIEMWQGSKSDGGR